MKVCLHCGHWVVCIFGVLVASNEMPAALETSKTGLVTFHRNVPQESNKCGSRVSKGSRAAQVWPQRRAQVRSDTAIPLHRAHQTASPVPSATPQPFNGSPSKTRPWILTRTSGISGSLSRVFEKEWAEMDLNHRRRKPAPLQFVKADL